MDGEDVGAEAPTGNEVRPGPGAAGDSSAAAGATGPVAGPAGTGPPASAERAAGAVPAPGPGSAAGVVAAANPGSAAGVVPAPDPGSAGRSREQSVRLVLWRHGQTRWNVEGRFQGQSDIPLDPLGEQQAERAARLLAALQPAAIFSSDLVRATATAAPLARLTGLRVIPEKDLRERYGGLWEGLTDVDIQARYPVEHSQWLPPGGEASATVADRAGAAMERIAETLAPGTLAVVVSHGAALRLGAERLLGLPEELWGAVGPLANCAWSVLGRRRGRWRLLEHNAGTLPEPVLSDDR
jgi:glucosyl-3-phosphoglycerate phosphatase